MNPHSSPKTINKNPSYPIGLILLLIIALSVLIISQRITQTNTPSEPPTQASTESVTPPLPVYPKATLLNSQNKIEEDLSFFQGTWETNTEVAEVVQWYTDHLQAQGWTANVPFQASTQTGTILSVWIPIEPAYAFVEIIITPLDSTTQIKVKYYPNMDILYPEDEEEE